ncbi:isoprenyl transferase [Parvularcula lutaonensis]|uniref:Isoprenyl transferase n=1 Tax=Parvularcula lutaonensis TaxID=491923 RepID=A0ABV7ME17_9PROT|nr:isoprenyl transferase [Parvularcula lutaonensis]GGY54404.1 isoprenyl transferase [Parvularcula lutaonensis]
MLAPKTQGEDTPAAHGSETGHAQHVAIIMDGNGRWAERRGVSRLEGHRAGVEAARRAVRAARELGVRIVTLYSFSTENWSRPDWEVRHLLGLLRRFFREDLNELAKEGVRVRVLGDHANLPPDLRKLCEDAEQQTAQNTDFILQVAFNYGGRDEIVRAAQKIAVEVAAGTLKAEDVSEAELAANLDTAGVPDPDLVIRTSGECRISNFLLWQAAYAELVFLDKFWPDFGTDDLAEALDVFRRRERRYGGRKGEAATAP